jgi:hypothetical protein
VPPCVWKTVTAIREDFPLRRVKFRPVSARNPEAGKDGRGWLDYVAQQQRTGRDDEPVRAAVRAQGLTVFTQVDHAAGAAAVGLSLRPTEVPLFGDARGGTPLMAAVQTIGIGLPLKVLVLAGRRW